MAVKNDRDNCLAVGTGAKCGCLVLHAECVVSFNFCMSGRDLLIVCTHRIRCRRSVVLDANVDQGLTFFHPVMCGDLTTCHHFCVPE
jgi:hypothetical protein